MNRNEVEAPQAEPLTLGRVSRTLKAYRLPILLSLAVVFCGYLIISSIIMIMSPALTVTSIPFRLTFDGAERGRYPNGLAFGPTDIVAQPVLARVWEINDLGRYMPEGVFMQSLYVIEANPALEQLIRDYQSRLADPKLNPIDRERLFREFDTKKASIAKNEYSLNYSAARDAHRLPDALVKKVLNDVLAEWAAHAIREQRVLQYGISVMSPSVVPPTGNQNMDFIARLHVLRANTFRVMNSLDSIQSLPGGMLGRAKDDKLSLLDIRTKLEDMIRFRLEPLVPAIRASGLITNVGEAIRFAEMQLAYDERQLATARDTTRMINQAIVTYANQTGMMMPQELLTAQNVQDGDAAAARQATSGSVSPLLTESFLDRLMEMTSATRDLGYRQNLIDEYRNAAARIPPLQQAVAYDLEILEHLRATPTGAPNITTEDVERQITTMQTEVHVALQKMNEIYDSISRNLAPGTHMYAATSIPTTRTERRIDAVKLAALGVLIFFLALPMILAGVLIHSRVQEDNRLEDEAVVAAEARA